MADLKFDLLNRIGNDKYYAELELARLANDANTNYEIKLDNMISLLDKINGLNSMTDLINFYFRVPEIEVEEEVIPPTKTKLK